MQRIFKSGVILACLSAFACGGGGTTQQEYIRRAEISLKNKDYAAAIIELRNGVRADPKAGPTRFLLASALEASGQLPQARNEYVRAADLMPTDAKAQLAAARLLLLGRQFEDAQTRAQEVLELDSKNAEAHLIRGKAAAGMDDLEGALKSFEDGLALDPKGTDLLVTRGQLRAIQGNSAEAEASFKQAIVVAPDSLDARLALADYYWYTGNDAATEQALKDAAGMNDPSGRAVRTLTAFYVARKRFAEAEAPLRRAIEVSPDPRLKLLLAEFLAGTGKLGEATPILQKLTEDPLTRGAATVRLASVEFSKPGHGNAYQLLDALLKADPSNAQVITRKAQFLAADGKRADALATVQSAIKADPQAAPPYELLGLLYLEAHDLPQAETALKEAIRLNGKAVGPLLLLATLNLTRQQATPATELAERALQNQPANGQAVLILVRALTADGHLDRARREVARLPQDNPLVQIAVGDLELRSGNKLAARAAYTRAIAMDSKSTDAQRGLVQVDALDKKLDSAVQRIDKALAANPNDAQMMFLAANTHMKAGDLAAAEAKARQALDKDPSLRPAYDLLGLIYRRQNRLEDAQRVFERVATERPADVPAHTMVGILQLVRGDHGEARKRFEKVLSIDPRAAVASNNLAYLDAEAGTNLDVALNRAQTAKAALPNDPEVDDTLGWIYVKKGLPALAQNPLNEAVKKDGKNPIYLYHLGKAYAAAGDRDRARTNLAMALKLTPNFPGADDAKKTLDSLGQ